MNEQLKKQIASQMMMAMVAAQVAQDLMRKAEDDENQHPGFYGGEIAKAGEIVGLARLQLAAWNA